MSLCSPASNIFIFLIALSKSCPGAHHSFSFFLQPQVYTKTSSSLTAIPPPPGSIKSHILSIHPTALILVLFLPLSPSLISHSFLFAPPFLSSLSSYSPSLHFCSSLSLSFVLCSLILLPALSLVHSLLPSVPSLFVLCSSDPYLSLSPCPFL